VAPRPGLEPGTYGLTVLLCDLVRTIQNNPDQRPYGNCWPQRGVEFLGNTKPAVELARGCQVPLGETTSVQVLKAAWFVRPLTFAFSGLPKAGPLESGVRPRSFSVPKHLGYLLHHCFSQGMPFPSPSILTPGQWRRKYFASEHEFICEQ